MENETIDATTESFAETDASCVPPRSDESFALHASVAHGQRNDTGPSPETESVANQERTESCEDAESSNAATNPLLADVFKPHDQWSFNKLILDISNALTGDELKHIKSMYKGVFDEKLLQKITDADSLFSFLRTRKFVSSINLLELCALLHFAGRNDLWKNVADYSEKTKDALYIYAPSFFPVNGYTHIEFHVAGRDFTKTTKRQLLEFKNTVCAMLTVPERFVLIDGVDPSGSITITLLMPDLHATILRNMLKNKEVDVIHLFFCGVDYVKIGDDRFYVQEVVSILPEVVSIPPQENEQQQLDMYEQLQRTKHALSDTELENITLRKKLKCSSIQLEKQNNLEKKVMELQAENDMWIRSVKPDGLFPDAETVDGLDTGIPTISHDIPKALENFKMLLAKMSETNSDKPLVLELLQAHATLIAYRCYNQLSPVILSTHMGLMNAMIMATIHGDLQRFMGLPDFRSEPVFRAFREISKRITPEEQQKLQKGYQWTEDDNTLLNSGMVPFFVMVLQKEQEKRVATGKLTQSNYSKNA